RLAEPGAGDEVVRLDAAQAHPAPLDAGTDPGVVPLNARLLPAGLAHPYDRMAADALHRDHRQIVEAFVRVGHTVDALSFALAMFSWSSFSQASPGLVVSSSYSKRSTISGSMSATST